MKNLFLETSRIRDFSKQVLSTSSSIKINWNPLDELIEKLITRENRINTNTNTEDSSFERQIGLLLLYGSVHYCFTNPATQIEYSYEKNGKKYFRSTAFITALKDATVNWQNFNEVIQLTENNWFDILQTDDEMKLFQIKERYIKMKSMAKFLISENIFSSLDLIKSISNAEQLIALLLKSGLFQDTFLKRAQVTTYLLSATLKDAGRKPYADINLLTGMPDYRLPQLLYNLGVIELSGELRAKLMSKTRILSKSPEEVALRSAVVVIVEYLSMILDKPECIVDSLLWGLSQEEQDLGNMRIPAMLVETDSY